MVVKHVVHWLILELRDIYMVVTSPIPSCTIVTTIELCTTIWVLHLLCGGVWHFELERLWPALFYRWCKWCRLHRGHRWPGKLHIKQYWLNFQLCYPLCAGSRHFSWSTKLRQKLVSASSCVASKACINLASIPTFGFFAAVPDVSVLCLFPLRQPLLLLLPQALLLVPGKCSPP